jgi:hypothetical protein
MQPFMALQPLILIETLIVTLKVINLHQEEKEMTSWLSKKPTQQQIYSRFSPKC